MPGAPPNRFVFIATYGHGKSHFAVAAANYFGKPCDAPELNSVLARIKDAAQDAPLYGIFEGFKRNHGPLLILVLRGDEPSDLQTKFFRAVEEALRYDSGSEETRAPFWYGDAERFVSGILDDTPDRRESANEFLSQHKLDLDLLLERIRAQEASTFEITRELCIHLNQFAPDFGTGLSLKEAIEWLGKNLVGPGKPYGGILVLFDEFSSFVWDYALRIRHRPGAPLQDLLNGVESMRGKVAFVAFAQRDPELIAKSLLGGDSLQSLTTQLNRLPKPQHYQLHSSLEEVLAAYLRQNRETWRRLLADSCFSRSLGEASDLCFDIFSDRYVQVLGWDIERFQEVVTKGVFPLHPATTALLSSVELETTNNPRSVLGFVLKHLDAVRDTAAYLGDQPTWVLPITLVDYFKEMLGQKCWNDYCDALGQAGGPDTPADDLSVLKAMLLQSAAKIATRGAYDRVIGHFAGISLERAAKALQKLAGSGVVRYDSANRVYTFWPAGRGANKVDLLLSEKLAGQTLDGAILEGLMKPLREEGMFKNLSVPIDWGHRDDWQAEQILASRATLTVDSLKGLGLDRLLWRPDGCDRPRGLVIWLVAETPEDAVWLRENAADVLSSAFPGQPIPLVIMKPDAADPECSTQLLRLHGLCSFGNADIAEVGQQQFEAVRQLSLESIKCGFKALSEDAEVEVPAPFKGRIATIRLGDLESVLIEMFKMAYCKGPRKWFTQYKLSSARLRTATARVSTYLVSNSLDTPEIFAGDNVAKDIVQLIRSDWALVGSDLRIKQPKVTSKVSPGWDLLQGCFPAGGRATRAAEAVTSLMNAPCGYDYNTLSLLLAAWFGFNRHDLEVSCSGALVSMKAVVKDLKPREFVEFVATVSIKRTDVDQVRTKIRQLLERVERGAFTKAEARDALQLFGEALEREDIDQTASIESACERLRSALESADKYDQSAGEVERVTDTCTHLIDLAKLYGRLAKIPLPELVKPERPAPGELRAKLLDRIRTVTEKTCVQYERLKTIADFGLGEQQLKLIRRTLDQIQIPELVARVDAALDALARAKVHLEQKQKDEAAIALLNSIEARGSLSQLRNQIRTIMALAPSTDAARDLAKTKLAAVSSEVARLQDFRTGIQGRIALIPDLPSLEQVESEVLQHLVLFDGSDESVDLQESVKHCKRLREFFGAVGALRSGSIVTPAEALLRSEKLNALRDEYRPFLAPCHEKVVLGAIRAIDRDTASAAEAALQWIDECERVLRTGGKLVDLASRVKSPPPFLPGEQQPRLGKLALEIEQLIERGKQDDAAVGVLKAAAAKGGLVQLRSQVTEVERLPIYSDHVRRLAEEKVAAIRAEIERLLSFQSGLRDRLARTLDAHAVEGVQSEVLRNLSQFDASEEAATLHSCLKDCKALRQFFDAVDAHVRAPIQTPADALRVLEGLNSLCTECGSFLAPDQMTVVTDAVAKIERHVAKESEAAVRWLAECERALTTGTKLAELAGSVKLPPPFLPGEQRPRLDALAVEIEQRIERGKQEEAALRLLKSVATKGSLAQLKDRVTVIRGLPLYTEVARRLAQDKLASIEGELAHLQNFQAGLKDRLGSTRDAKAVEALRSDLLRNLNLFDDSDEAGNLQRALDDCARLRAFFEAVEVQRRSPVHSPAKAHETIEQLNCLCDQGRSILTPGQVAVASRVMEDVERAVREHCEVARKWMAERELALLSGGKLDELATALSSPPPFLPDDEKPRLAALIGETRQRIDDDQVLQVVVHFKQITDALKRSECLDRLTKLAEETQPV